MKRVAVCLSGQIRTWKKVINTWDKIVNSDVQVDYFIHMWNETSVPVEGLTHRQIELIKLNQSEIDTVINTIRPVKFSIDSQEDYKKTLIDDGYYNPYECQYYSMFKSCELKTKYEQENGFIYDVVVKSRFDLFFNQDIIKNTNIQPNTIYAYSPTYDENNVLDRVADIFFYSDSKTANKLSNYLHVVNDLPEYYRDWSIPPEFAWFYHLKNSNIDIDVNHWDIKVVRNNMDEVKNKNFDYEMIL
jgi:hypothetical protein